MLKAHLGMNTTHQPCTIVERARLRACGQHLASKSTHSLPKLQSPQSAGLQCVGSQGNLQPLLSCPLALLSPSVPVPRSPRPLVSHPLSLDGEASPDTARLQTPDVCPQGNVQPLLSCQLLLLSAAAQVPRAPHTLVSHPLTLDGKASPHMARLQACDVCPQGNVQPLLSCPLSLLSPTVTVPRASHSLVSHQLHLAGEASSRTAFTAKVVVPWPA
jgi:hypothetical protein